MTTPNWKDAIDDANQRDNEQRMQDTLDAWEASRSGGKHEITPEEREDLKDYLSEGGSDRWKERAKLDVDNRKATQDLGLTEIDGSYYDRWGRECRSDGTRY